MTTTPTAVEVLDHNDGLADVITTLLRDCTLAGLRPCHVDASNYASGFFYAGVQFTGEDTASVDALAATWQLRDDDGKTGNYTRGGVIDVNGQTVTLTVYTGRPKLPAYPAGYAPVAVQA